MANDISAKDLAGSLTAFDEKLKMLLTTQKRLKWDLEKTRKENEKLKAENARIEKEYQEIKKKHRQLERDFNRSRFFAKIVTNKLTPTGGISELKEDIDHYIKNIDAVIAKLKQTL